MYCSLIATCTLYFIGSFNNKALLQQPIYAYMIFYDIQLEVLLRVHVCMCVRVRACVCACVRACVCV